MWLHNQIIKAIWNNVYVTASSGAEVMDEIMEDNNDSGGAVTDQPHDDADGLEEIHPEARSPSTAVSLGPPIRYHNNEISQYLFNQRLYNRPGGAAVSKKQQIQQQNLPKLQNLQKLRQRCPNLLGSLKRRKLLSLRVNSNNDIFNLSREERQRIKAMFINQQRGLIKLAQRKPGESELFCSNFLTKSHEIMYSKQLNPLLKPFATSLCSHTGSLLSFEELKNRMTVLSMDYGLTEGVSDDSVTVLSLALEVCRFNFGHFPPRLSMYSMFL